MKRWLAVVSLKKELLRTIALLWDSLRSIRGDGVAGKVRVGECFGLRLVTVGDHRTTGLADAGDFVSEAASLLTQRCETVGVFLRQRLR